MPTLIRKARSSCRSIIGRLPGDRGEAPGARAGARARVQPGSQEGFLLIEVIISAMLVAIIVIGTFNGFDVLTRSSAEQRRRNEAALLAAESQQKMRSEPASTLLAFANNENSYAASVAGTSYTIVQKASFGNGSAQTGCSASESSKGQGAYILISSTVTWTHMSGKPVSESSIITPPTGSALEVEVSNGGGTATSGVSVVVKFTPAGTSGTSTLEGTTGNAGCVLFAGIPSTSAKVEIKETNGIVNRFGTLSWPVQTLTLAPNVLTKDPVTLAPGGSIIAAFHYNSATTYKHQNNSGSGEVEEAVTGDTFVAYNIEMKKTPDFELGNPLKPTPYSKEHFEVLPGTFASTATSPTETIKFPHGDLFPFPSPKAWSVYAGDCTANNPLEVNTALKLEGASALKEPATTVVAPAATVEVSVPTAYVQFNDYTQTQTEIAALKAKGESVWPYLETSKAWPVKITNKKCAGVIPNNAIEVNPAHTQTTTTGGEWGGHLSSPFQPFGEFELCLATSSKRFKVSPYENQSETAAVTRNIYLPELTASEKAAIRVAAEKVTREAREAVEHTAKTKRESEEATTKKARETTEASTKAARIASELPAKEKWEKEEKTEKETKSNEETKKSERETKEKSEKKTWEEEVSKNKSSKATKEKEDKEKNEAQEKARKTAEATEKTAREKRESEEKATATARKTQETTAKTAETEEASKRSTAESEEASKRSTAETKEATERSAAEAKESTEKTKAVEAENAEIAAREDVVEAGSSC